MVAIGGPDADVTEGPSLTRTDIDPPSAKNTLPLGRTGIGVMKTVIAALACGRCPQRGPGTRPPSKCPTSVPPVVLKDDSAK